MSWLDRRLGRAPRIGGVTEAEWLAAQDFVTVLKVYGAPAPARVRWLYFAHMARRLSAGFEAQTRGAVEVAERYAEGHASGEELHAACHAAADSVRGATEALRLGGAAGPRDLDRPSHWAALTAVAMAQTVPVPPWEEPFEATRGFALMTPLSAWAELDGDLAAARDLLGNPFRPVPPVRAEWITADVLGLAWSAYESRDFSGLPVLADALEEAGCDSPDLLEHLRGGGVHVRGCRALDSLLGWR